MPSDPAKFVWYDVMTTDTKAAEAFYRSVIGRDIRESGMSDRSYLLLSAGPTMVGGLMPIPADARAMGAPASWTGYVGVADVDAYAARVRAGGGQVVNGPHQVPGGNWVAQCIDPQGAMFALAAQKR